MKLTTSLLERSLLLLERLKNKEIDSSALEALLLEILEKCRTPPKHESVTYRQLLLKLAKLEDQKYSLEEKSLEEKFCDFFCLDLDTLMSENDDFSLEDAKRELGLLKKESKHQTPSFNYLDGLTLLKKHSSLALTSKSSYIRLLATLVIEEEKHSS